MTPASGAPQPGAPQPGAPQPGAQWPGTQGPAAREPATGPARRWHAEHAWLGRGSEVARDVLVEASGERFTSVTPDTPASELPPGTTRLPGLTLPGLANAHSHAFHRALRGGAGTSGDSFWTWRDRMYSVAERLDPETYYALARATFAEMALAGITCVGEFHYLHRQKDGTPYTEPNDFGLRLLEAASAAGLRITLLDTCYLAGGLDPGGVPRPLDGVQLRFGDGTAADWAARVAGLGCDPLGMLGPHARIGAAIHSVRAVPPDQMPEVVAWSHHHGAPLHVHLSEQPLENAEARAAFGKTPAELLDEAGVLGPRSTMVHATHLTETDVALLGACRSFVCMCPLTEADLGDGVGPAPALAAAGCTLSLGSDGHSAIDLLAEARWLELAQRLTSRHRGHFTVADQAMAATTSGHSCLGWPDAGEIVPGAYADLVTVALDSPRLAGVGDPLGRVLAAGTATDVRHVVAAGRDVVRDGHHLLVEDVPGALEAAISAVTSLVTLSVMEQPRSEFHHQLDVIQATIAELFGMVTEDLPRATRALLDGRDDSPGELALRERAMDSLYLEVEQLASKEILLQAPVAQDLRFLLSVLRIAPELERSHDLVMQIDAAASRAGGAELSPPVRELAGRMGHLVAGMWRQAAGCWGACDHPVVTALSESQEVVDELHASLIAELETGRMTVPATMGMTLVARCYERLGSHAVNISRREAYAGGAREGF